MHEGLGAVSLIPAKRDKAICGLQEATEPECASPFRTDCIGRRALVESVFSALKRKLSRHGHRAGALKRSVKGAVVEASLHSLPLRPYPA